jgi:sugar O-acyltransferase (sialic acid O-acetyltransferase NeuD family)
VANRVIIWGASAHSRVVADILRADGQAEIAGFIDDVTPERAGEIFDGAPILGGREALAAALQRGVDKIILAFGDCDGRLAAARVARELGFDFVSARHPAAIVAGSARIGTGTVIAANAVVNVHAVIGDHVIVNTSASIDHDCVVGNGAHISPGARLGGSVKIGEAAWVGIGAVVSDHRTVGERSIIGAGAVVVRDVPPGVIAYGVPARVMRRRD